MKITITNIDRSNKSTFVVYKINNKIFTMNFGSDVSNILDELKKIHNDQ